MADDEHKIDPNAWMVTFGDLIMLLLTFFVMLLTMKSMNASKLEDISQSVNPIFGPMQYPDARHLTSRSVEAESGYGKALNITNFEMLQRVMATIDTIRSLERERTVKVEAENVEAFLEIFEDERGVVLTLESGSIFPPGGAELLPENLPVLDTIGRLFRYAENDIIIMGHTDNIPPSGKKFKSNNELSLYRALSVLYYLTDSTGLKADRFAAGGYGGRRPRFSNATPEGRAKNRRVEFVLKSKD